MGEWSFKNDSNNSKTSKVLATLASAAVICVSMLYIKKSRECKKLKAEKSELERKARAANMLQKARQVDLPQTINPKGEKDVKVFSLPNDYFTQESAVDKDRSPYIINKKNLKTFVLKDGLKLEALVCYLIENNYIVQQDAESFCYHFTSIRCSEKPVGSVEWRGREEVLFCIIHQFTDGLYKKYLRCYESDKFFIIKNSKFYHPENGGKNKLSITNEKYPFSLDFVSFFEELYEDVKQDMEAKRNANTAAAERARTKYKKKKELLQA